MAARFDAQGDRLEKTSTPTGDWSVSLWFRMAAAQWSPVLNFDNVTNWLYGGVTDAGASYLEVNGTTSQGSNGEFTTNTWYGLTLARDSGASPDSHTLRYYSVTGSVIATRVVNSDTIGNQIRIGHSAVYAGDWVDGRVAALKFWTAVLTQVELENELRFYMPLRTTNIWGVFPCLDANTDTTDFSGTGNTLSRNQAITYEDGPPVTWKSDRHRFVHIVGAIAADVSLIFPAQHAMAPLLVR
jgi:hypothetical protein